MRAQLRFLPKPGYVPKIHVYSMLVPKGPGHVEQESRAEYYIKFQLSDKYCQGMQKPINEQHHHREPKSLRAISRSMIDRELGGQLLKEIMQPGDYLIVDDLAHVFTKEGDVVSLMERFQERGQHLHILNFYGCCVDCDSPAGTTLIEWFKIGQEFTKEARRRVLRVARSRARVITRYAGAGVPFFCDVIEHNGDTMLVLKPWAIPAADIIAHQLETDGADRRPPVIARMINSAGLGHGWKKTYKNCLYVYWFARAWEAAGRPNVNDLKFPDFVYEYRVKVTCGLTEEVGVPPTDAV